MTNNELIKLKRKLSKYYDEGRIRLTSNASMALGWGMNSWQAEHCRGGFAQYSTEQYNRALKRRTIGLCVECPDCYTIDGYPVFTAEELL